MDNDFKGKAVLVMGLGLSGGGVGTVEFLVKRGAKVTVTDLRTRRELAPSLKTLAKYGGIRYVLGRHRKEDFLKADIIIKNPGVRRDAPLLVEAARRRIPITSDIGIFFRLCPAKIIGVTGTRGKSTATYLIWKFLKSRFSRPSSVRSVWSSTSNTLKRARRIHYGGNIRRSVLTLLPRIRKDDLVVLELSSFQLQDLAYEKRSPHIAIVTNILKDHLNWHRNMKEYIRAKSAIFQFQRKNDILFINRRDALLRQTARPAPVRARGAALPPTLLKTVNRNIGAHYRPSVALAIAAARHFGVGLPAIHKVLGSFRGLEGRQEKIATVKGIHFINDTTATIPDAAIAAIRRFRDNAGAKHKLILIAGGSDKKLDFAAMAAAIKKYVDTLVLLPGDATEKLIKNIKTVLPYSLIRTNKRIGKGKMRSIKSYKAESMADAVRTAMSRAEKGDYVLLSPGAASFGLFLNEFDRGNQFVQAVRK